MYHTILKRLLNALPGNIKIMQVHTECVTFYSTFNRDFYEILGFSVQSSNHALKLSAGYFSLGTTFLSHHVCHKNIWYI